MHIALPASYLGTQLDRRYRLDRLIGEGASAWVFAARDLRLERDVAVKLLKPHEAEERPTQLQRFIAEGRTLAMLDHPHVVLVHDAGETAEGLGYLVMELSHAGTLEGELCRRPILPAEETVRLLLPLMGALACAHDRGIVHRDIKPANIALAHERGETRTKVLDFGIAKGPDVGASTDSARGTPSYMAPEQARGEKLSPAADVWALGVVFYRCLSGQTPFAAATSLESLLKLVHERAPRFSETCPGLPPHLAIALDRALEPDLRCRYASMRDFARAVTVACTQDGLGLPERPDLRGLPEFDGWRAQANMEPTASVSGRASLRPVPSAKRVRWQRRRALVVGLIAALVVALGLAGMLKRDESQAGITRPAPTPALADESRPLARPRPTSKLNFVPSQRAIAMPPIRVEAALPPPSRVKRRGVRSKASSPPLRPAPIAHEPAAAASVADAPAKVKQGLVTNWNW